MSTIGRIMDSIVEEGSFPKFANADVIIVIASDKHYHLDAATLRTGSDFFDTALANDKAAPLSTRARQEGITTRWRLELQMPEDGEEDRFGWLTERARNKPLDSNGKPRYRLPIGAGEHPFQVLSTDKRRLYGHYDNVLRAHFKQPLKLEYGDSRTTLEEVLELFQVADRLDSARCLSAAFDGLTGEQLLLRSIAFQARDWGDLARRVRSELLFKESVVHLVGQWNMFSGNEKMQMHAELRELCQSKADELDKIKKTAELDILGHYPTCLQTLRARDQNVGAGSRTTRGRGLPTRSVLAYGGQIMGWMALNLFRHWLGQSIAGDWGRRAPDGGLALYVAVAGGGERYIDLAAREAFVRHFPLSAKARNSFDAALSEIKDAVRPYAIPLVTARTALDLVQHPVRWLTCAQVHRADIPWLKGETRMDAVEDEGPTTIVDELSDGNSRSIDRLSDTSSKAVHTCLPHASVAATTTTAQITPLQDQSSSLRPFDDGIAPQSSTRDYTIAAETASEGEPDGCETNAQPPSPAETLGPARHKRARGDSLEGSPEGRQHVSKERRAKRLTHVSNKSVDEDEGADADNNRQRNGVRSRASGRQHPRI